ncbi:unnamed protein product [Prorocentrum cordatum]|uniref:Uncharacterized protein n=1 Tax=Prorocentrum cordatum TaxID=2364126 RepID=A0ABN9WAK3_9DINO|nr:unnamed protein product [Polarella glacialis]
MRRDPSTPSAPAPFGKPKGDDIGKAVHEILGSEALPHQASQDLQTRTARRRRALRAYDRHRGADSESVAEARKGNAHADLAPALGPRVLLVAADPHRGLRLCGHPGPRPAPGRQGLPGAPRVPLYPDRVAQKRRRRGVDRQGHGREGRAAERHPKGAGNPKQTKREGLLQGWSGIPPSRSIPDPAQIAPSHSSPSSNPPLLPPSPFSLLLPPPSSSFLLPRLLSLLLGLALALAPLLLRHGLARGSQGREGGPRDEPRGSGARALAHGPGRWRAGDGAPARAPEAGAGRAGVPVAVQRLRHVRPRPGRRGAELGGLLQGAVRALRREGQGQRQGGIPDLLAP